MKERLLFVCLIAGLGASLAADEAEIAPRPRSRFPEDARLIAANSRKTITTVTTSTTTAPVTCATSINPVACGKRRRRLFSQNQNKKLAAMDSPGGLLDSSLDAVQSDNAENEKARLSYTVWWSITTTLTHITTVNTGVTFSVSYMCSVAGATYPALCAG